MHGNNAIVGCGGQSTPCTGMRIDVQKNVVYALRDATLNDLHAIYALSNDPGVRRSSIHPEPIPWETHVAWCKKRLSSDAPPYYLAESPSGEIIGQVRFDPEGESMVISISLAADWRGRGLGRLLIRDAIEKAQLKHVIAYVREDNEASLAAFQHAGFVDSHLRKLIFSTPDALV